MNKPTCRWMQCALDALQIEEYIARYVLSFRRSWLRDWQSNDLLHDTLLSTQLRRAVGIEGDGDDLIRKVKFAFVDLMTGSERSAHGQMVR
jgi:hypothetical protein